MILADFGRTFPQVPVEVGGRFGGRLEADAPSRLAAVAVGDLEPAKLSLVNGFVEAGDFCVAAALRAVLHHHAVLLLRLEGGAALADVVAHRLFDVNVFPRLAGPNRDQGVPVIGGGDRNRVERAIFEGLANVGQNLGLRVALRRFLDGLPRPRQHVVLGIDQVHNLDVRLLKPALDVRFAAAVETGDRDPQTVVGSDDLPRGTGPRNQQRSAGSGSALQEIAS